MTADGGVGDVVPDAERTAFLPPVNEHDPATRRRVAEAAAHAADLRASAAAAEAKAAIAAAARAAELADAAARAAELADAAVLAATEAEVRAADRPPRSPTRAADAVPGEEVAAPDGFPTAVVPAPRPRSDAGGRVARWRVESADTAVLAAVEAGAEPTAPGASEVAEAEVAKAPVERPTRSASRRARAAVAAKEETAVAEIAPRRRGLFRRPAPPVLAAAAAGGVLALTGMLFASTSGNQNPMPAAVIEAAPITAPAVPVLPSDSAAADEGDDAASGPAEFDESVRDGEVDVLTHHATTYLRALRAAGVPTSREGVAETEAAELVCGELADGVAEERIARALPASLPTVSRAQAADLVEIARDAYCNAPSPS